MGCTSSIVTVSKLKLSPETPVSKSCIADEISNEDKRIVKKTWKYLSTDIVELGVKVFLNLFAVNPATKRVFPFHDLDGDDLLMNIRFKGHSTRLMQTLQTVIDNIDALETTAKPLLVEIGKQHYAFQGFHKVYWDACPEAILRTWRDMLQDKFTETKYKAWSDFVAFVIAQLKEGYDAGSAEMIQVPKRQKRMSVM